MESLQLLIYFGGLVTASIASIAYLITNKTWIASAIILPMFVFISFYSDFQVYVILIGVGFALLSYLISLAIKMLMTKDKKSAS
jgi:hypothetical protein